MGPENSWAGAALSLLEGADARLGTDRDDWRTLDPDREHATSLAAIGRAVLVDCRDAALALAFAEGLDTVASAMREAFPDNLLWDLDYLAASVWRHAAGNPIALAEHARAIAAVQRVFGRHTAIGFAYVHDFTYGYDWAKWIGRDRAARSLVPPFGSQFVAVMQTRGEELLDVIAQGRDATYPPLRGEGPRNPFGFSREPSDELRLHRHLARAGELPIAAYRADTKLDPTRPYGQLRRDAAATLGLSR